MNVLTRFNELYSDLAQLKLDELDSVYHKDIVFVDPIASHEGIAAVKNYFSSLLTETKSCSFKIHNIMEVSDANSSVSHVVLWTMTLCSKQLNKGKPVTLDGTSMLGINNDRIIFHKDFYDMGQMVYEHIPVVGFFVKKIKQRMAK